MRRSSVVCFILATLLTLAGLAPAAGAATPPTFYEANGHYYEVVATSGTWNQARAEAETFSYLGSSGHLVTITSDGESAFVDALDGRDSGYIGLHDQASEGTFQWVTGEPVGYTHWRWGEPNNDAGIEDCAHTWYGPGWNDSICDMGGGASYFVVEYDGPFDSDGDGVYDGEDAFAHDAGETMDSDGDDLGDNADPDETDGPLADSDGDGALNGDDAFPNDADETTDTDSDGTGDGADNCSLVANGAQDDTDGDGQGDLCEATHSRSIALKTQDLSILYGEQVLKLSGRLYVADAASKCVGHTRVFLQRYNAKTARWLDVGDEIRTRNGGYAYIADDVAAKYRATVRPRAVTYDGFKTRCTGASAATRHRH